ncbi:Retinal homeobox protein Rx1, partial [Geodia barretti]
RSCTARAALGGESQSPQGDKPTGTTSTNDPPAEPSSASSDQREEPVEEEEEEEQPKKKRVRTAYTREQLQAMERHFRKSAYPDSQLLKIISSEARIPIPKIQVWFQNRRAKARKWGQVLPEPSSNSALYRGALPSSDSSRYLPPLQPSSSPCSKTTPTQETPPTTSLNSHPLSSSSLLPPFLTPYQRLYQPPPYALLPPPLPYPLSYSIYAGVQSNNPTVASIANTSFNFQNSASQPVITVDSNKEHF